MQLPGLAGRRTLELPAKLPQSDPKETRECLREAFVFTPSEPDPCKPVRNLLADRWARGGCQVRTSGCQVGRGRPQTKLIAAAEKRRSVIASIFTIVLLSLAGIPSTMGFKGKFYVLAAGAASSAWPLIFHQRRRPPCPVVCQSK